MSLTKAFEHGKEPIMTDYSTILGYPMRYERGGIDRFMKESAS